MLCHIGQFGLFSDDVAEACGSRTLAMRAPSPAGPKFNPSAARDKRLVDLLRHLVITRDLFPTSANRIRTPSQRYRVSSVEIEEVERNVHSTESQSLGSDIASNSNTSAGLHQWGVQLAGEVEDPREGECLAEIREIRPIIEETVKRAREGAQSFSKKFEPLTWRSLLKRSTKHPPASEEENYRLEPIPGVVVITDREPVVASPQVVSTWERSSLGRHTRGWVWKLIRRVDTPICSSL